MKPKYFFLVLVVLLIFVTASAIMLTGKNMPFDNSPLIFEKGSSYEEIWKKVDEFDKKGLPQSALEIVEAIYVQAKNDTNYAQIIKAIIYKQKYKISLEEDAYQKIINEMQAEIDSAGYPLRPVLHSLLADIYWSFYQNNRWRFYNRTETVGFNPTDINTWDLSRILNACIEHHTLALENADSLKRTKIDFYDDILVAQPTSRQFRPTLYDFLAHRAIDFFRNSEAEITKPANTFKVDKADYFLPVAEFVNLNPDCHDTMSLKYNAMMILKDLLAFHLNDVEPDALVDADLKRIQFVYQNSIHPDSDSLYHKALKDLEQKYIHFEISADVSYRIACYYEAQGYKYQPLNSDEHKWEIKKAYEYCADVMKRHPKSFGATNCQYLQERIKNKSIYFTEESYCIPGKPSLMSMTYRNIDKLYIRVIKIDWKKHRNDLYDIYGEDLMKYLAKLDPVKEFSVDLKDDGDYQSHNTELKMPELETGYYLVLASNDKSFTHSKNGIAYGYIQATNLCFTERKDMDNAYDVYVFDRESGKPLKGVSATLWKDKYDYLLKRYKLSKYKTFTTDKDGFFHVPATSENGVSYYIELNNGSDGMYSTNQFYQYKPYYYDQPSYIYTYFFT
ncbi:MAG: hypothetical protein ABIJ16_06530, partial [Bacteroidota bacterium]